MSKPWQAKVLTFLRGQVVPLVFFGLVFASFRSSIADWNDVPTGSMNPTILEGDRIFVNKLAYDLKVPFTTVRLAEWSDPRRGDIVVFYSPVDGERLVKRVVAVPGDTVEMVDNHLLLNGVLAEYGPLDAGVSGQMGSRQTGHTFAAAQVAGESHPVMNTPGIPAKRSFGPVTVPPGKFFMMGDNRDNSYDSRYYGLVERRLIVGRSSTIAGSVDLNSDSFKPRWDRFFKELP